MYSTGIICNRLHRRSKLVSDSKWTACLTAMGSHTIKFDLDKKIMYKHLSNSLSADAITLVEAHFLYSDHTVAGGNVGDPDVPVRGC